MRASQSHTEDESKSLFASFIRDDNDFSKKFNKINWSDKPLWSVDKIKAKLRSFNRNHGPLVYPLVIGGTLAAYAAWKANKLAHSYGADLYDAVYANLTLPARNVTISAEGMEFIYELKNMTLSYADFLPQFILDTANVLEEHASAISITPTLIISLFYVTLLALNISTTSKLLLNRKIDDRHFCSTEYENPSEPRDTWTKRFQHAFIQYGGHYAIPMAVGAALSGVSAWFIRDFTQQASNRMYKEIYFNFTLPNTNTTLGFGEAIFPIGLSPLTFSYIDFIPPFLSQMLEILQEHWPLLCATAMPTGVSMLLFSIIASLSIGNFVDIWNNMPDIDHGMPDLDLGLDLDSTAKRAKRLGKEFLPYIIPLAFGLLLTGAATAMADIETIEMNNNIERKLDSNFIITSRNLSIWDNDVTIGNITYRYGDFMPPFVFDMQDSMRDTATWLAPTSVCLSMMMWSVITSLTIGNIFTLRRDIPRRWGGLFSPVPSNGARKDDDLVKDESHQDATVVRPRSTTSFSTSLGLGLAHDTDT